ncbi:MAG: GAF domain-containing protein [Rhodocyclaceae bacterium]|nr:GAF domain-containing protein [Rhodocyclaceae bacterium]
MRASLPLEPPRDGSELTLAALRWQNDVYRGRGGVSEEIRPLGFHPAFYDMETGQVYPSRFANGICAPMHVLDGLPEELVACRLPGGRVAATRPGVVAGFERHGNFYTREQAAHAAAQICKEGELFSNPENHAALLAAWEHFMLDEAYSGELLRPIVEDSWHRCHSLNLDPELPAAPLELEQEAARDRYPSLRAAARPVLLRAGAMLASAESVAVLAAYDGVIVDATGDCRTRDHARDCNLVVGGQWSESSVGTNAIGTALAEEQPVQLFGAEHYCEAIKRWTCSAEVIRDPHDGHVVGVLDISGLTNSYRRQALEFAMTGARLIERNLSIAYFRARSDVVLGSAEWFQRWPGEGLLAFDRCGRLVRANGAAHRALERLGIVVHVTPQTRVAELDLDAWSGARPDWAQNCHPVKRARGVVGSLVVLPGQS